MVLTAEYLSQLRAGAEEKRAVHIAMVNQATGAIAMIDVLLNQLAASELPAKKAE